MFCVPLWSLDNKGYALKQRFWEDSMERSWNLDMGNFLERLCLRLNSKWSLTIVLANRKWFGKIRNNKQKITGQPLQWRAEDIKPMIHNLTRLLFPTVATWLTFHVSKFQTKYSRNEKAAFCDFLLLEH